MSADRVGQLLRAIEPMHSLTDLDLRDSNRADWSATTGITETQIRKFCAKLQRFCGLDIAELMAVSASCSRKLNYSDLCSNVMTSMIVYTLPCFTSARVLDIQGTSLVPASFAMHARSW